MSTPTTMRLPDFICLGAMRCGTTTLWSLLDRQPGVFLPRIKELHYFDGYQGGWDAGPAAYAAHFADAPADAVCGEITPSYLYIEEACGRIRDLVPDVRLIAILRDPVERAWSHYWYEVCGGRETLSFRRAIDAEPRRLASGRIEERIHRSYFDRGLYAGQLQRFADAFGRDRLCVLDLKALIHDPEAAMRRVLGHIGVAGAPAINGQNKDRQRNRGWHPRLRQAHPALKALHARFDAGRSLPSRAARRVVSRLMDFNRIDGVPAISDADRAWLADRYADADAQLAPWFDGHVPWRTPAHATA